MTDHPAINLRARTDRRLIRSAARSHRFVLVELGAPPATRQRQRPPVNLSFVIDRSGSMSGQKLELAKQAVLEAIGRLDDRDRFSVVAYDDDVRVVVERTAATQRACRDAADQLRNLGPGGSTNLSGGWLKGAEEVAARQDADAVNRVLLLTDGLANVGMTDPGELAGHAGELRLRGISTTTFGVGNDFDETLLQSMADAGGGHFYYIAGADQIRDHIASEVGETLEIVARDVALEVIASEGVQVEAISPQAVDARGTRSVVTIGDLVANQAVEVVLRLTFPYGDLGRDARVMVGLGDEMERLTWTYADHPTNDAQPRDRDVDRAVARQFAARARQEAVQHNRRRDFTAAESLLKGTAKRIRGYAKADPMLRELVAELEEETQSFAAPMAEVSLKKAYFASSNLARSRDVQGRSLRSERS